MKNIKKIVWILIITLVAFSFGGVLSIEAEATGDTKIVTIERLKNGYYYETIIEDDVQPMFSVLATRSTITRTKTTNLKNNSGDTMWSVSIKATFSFDGTSVKCTSCTPSATSYDSAWTIQSVTSSKTSNSATATAVARHTTMLGILTQDYTKSVTITCSPNGEVS